MIIIDRRILKKIVTIVYPHISMSAKIYTSIFIFVCKLFTLVDYAVSHLRIFQFLLKQDWVSPCLPGEGGGEEILHPSRILSIDQKCQQMLTRNFHYIIQRHFAVFNETFRVIRNFKKMEFQWRRFSPFSVKKRQMFRSFRMYSYEEKCNRLLQKTWNWTFYKAAISDFRYFSVLVPKNKISNFEK